MDIWSRLLFRNISEMEDVNLGIIFFLLAVSLVCGALFIKFFQMGEYVFSLLILIIFIVLSVFLAHLAKRMEGRRSEHGIFI
ncbi:DUF1774 domain-containing protein [Candidatus Bathyarchaeota archaeon]|nr:DUF1774 domain-containing protein [Candidatus Bathyarchaeota archaeon]